MGLALAIVNRTFIAVTNVICRVRADALKRVPAQGPLIVVANHVNFLDLPIVFPRLSPRPVTGFAKVETWDNPFMAYLFDLIGAIPIRRGEVDLTALRSALRALDQGKIVGVAPEGTRSGDGVLQRGRSGVVTMALKSGAPLLPMVYYGGEKLIENLRRLRRTEVRVEVGELFSLDSRGEKVTRTVREKMVEEIMYQLAALLPAEYRGPYSTLEAATEKYLDFQSRGTTSMGG